MTQPFVFTREGRCDFCGSTAEESVALLRRDRSPTIICDQCVGLSLELLTELVAASASADDRAKAWAQEVRQKVDESPELKASIDPKELDEIERRFRDSAASGRPSADRSMCSFCGARQTDVARLISGPGIFICNDCVTAAVARVSSLPSS